VGKRTGSPRGALEGSRARAAARGLAGVGKAATRRIDQRPQPASVNRHIGTVSRRGPAAMGATAPRMERHHHLVWNCDRGGADIRRDNSMALRICSDGIGRAIHHGRAGTIGDTVEQRIWGRRMDDPGSLRDLRQSKKQRKDREPSKGRDDTKLRMLHCDIAKYFVTIVTKASIKHSDKQDDNRQEPRTAKFGEIAARSGKKGRSHRSGLLLSGSWEAAHETACSFHYGRDRAPAGIRRPRGADARLA